MEIRTYEQSMMGGLSRCYNEIVSSIPYYRSIPDELFTDLSLSQWQGCEKEEVLVAIERDEMIGFVHVGTAAPVTKKWQVQGGTGVIRFFSYRVGERPIGAALLSAAENWLKEKECKEVVAGYAGFSYPFYPLPMANISERISHLPPLFGMTGYTNQETEVFFQWLNFSPPRPEKPNLKFDLVCEEGKTGIEQIGINVRALRDGQQIGICEMSHLAHDRWRPQFADWCECNLLLIDDEFQGKGLGKYLLSVGLAEMQAAGARHALVSTDWDNHRAFLFYTNFGYRFLDRTLGFRKVLG